MMSPGSQLQQAAGHFQRGEFQLAESCCRRLLEQSPGLFDARHLLGLSLLQQGLGEAALGALRRADRQCPGNLRLRGNMALALINTGQLDQACAVLEQLLSEHPDNQDVAYQMASLLNRLERDAEAEDLLLKLLKSNPDHPAANGLLAQMMEQSQQDERALEYAELALRAQPSHFVAGLSRARVWLREGRIDQAQVAFENLLENTDSRVNRSLVLTALGKMQDQAGQYQKAFAHFLAANTELSQSAAARQVRDTSVYSLAAQRELNEFFDDQRLGRWAELAAPASDSFRAPTFLVGFPRSGTTLLDRMLDAHPRITVIEEQPTLHATLARFVQDRNSLNKLETLDADGAARLRTDYWQRVSGHLGDNWNQDRVIIDKLPLNLIFIGLIYRIFPNARIIFAIRDPRDVCLSCFMQSFGLNDAMSHFLQLKSTARYYASAMTLGLRQLDALPVAQHHCRYEDLIEDSERQLRAVLEFLQLPWDSSILEFQQRLRGQRINTPSYEQVARPLYQSSLGRWRHYTEQLQPILADLQPFVDRFGYNNGSGK